MFLHLFTALLLVSPLSNDRISSVTALPGPAQPSFLSIPLSLPNHDDNTMSSAYIHGSIIQQLHTNRGLKRLALMTGRRIPSEYELLSTIYKRIIALSPPHRQKCDIETIGNALASDPSGERDMIRTSEYSASSSSLVSRTANSNVSNFSSAESLLHSIGLDIESNDIGYIGTMQMGTPPRDFHLLIDSGSADLWVGGEGCRSDDGGGCGNHTFLGSNSSRTFNASKEDWGIGYVSGSVYGFLIQDDVSIAGLKLKGHTFGVALNESSDFTPDTIPFDGLLGLGKEMISQQRVPTLLQSLYQAHLIPAPVASYKLPRLADGTNDGELTLGAMDRKHYDPKSLVKIDNINKFGYWGVPIDVVKVGKKDMKWSNRTVVLDTGTTLIIAPQNDVDAIHANIPGAQYDGSGWTVPCNMTTILSLTIGGQCFNIDPRDIAFYPLESGSQECMSGIAVGGVGPFYLDTDWLVGDVFLKNVYFSTDEGKDQISIAKPRA